MALNGRKFNGAELGVHFRINDEVQVYCGLTVILAVKRLQRPDGDLKIYAHGKYTGQLRAKNIGLFRRWADDEQGLSEAIEAYLGNVYVNPSFTTGEGVVQSLWSRVTDPWVPFDREAVLNYESTEIGENRRCSQRWKRPVNPYKRWLSTADGRNRGGELER